MIMTFKETTFSRVKLEERLDDLVKQDIYKPECLIIDGFDFASADRGAVKELREFMENHGLKSYNFV